MRFTINHVSTWKIIYNFSMELVALISVFYFLILMFIGRTKINAVCLMLFLMMLYELCLSWIRNMFMFPAIIIDVVPWPCIFLVFYDYSKNSEFPPVFKSMTVIGMSLICFLCIPNILEHYAHYNGGSIFATYYCLALLPMVYLFCSKRVSFIYSVIVAVIMLFTLKRAALIIVVSGIAVYYFLQNYNENASRKKLRRMLIYFIGVIAAVFAGQYIIEKFDLNIISRLANIFDDGGSGRVAIWNQIMGFFRTSSLSEKALGHGFHAVYYNVKPLGIARYAHNSWLETLYDYGYVGVTFITIFVLHLIIVTVKLIKRKHRLSPIMAYTMVPLIVLSVASYFFEQSLIIIPIMMVWGICLGRLSNKKYLKETMR